MPPGREHTAVSETSCREEAIIPVCEGGRLRRKEEEETEGGEEMMDEAGFVGLK